MVDAAGALRGMFGVFRHGAPAAAGGVLDDAARVATSVPTAAESASRVAHFASLRDADGMVRVLDEAGRIGNGMHNDPLWHQKTPIYQIYTRTFADGLGTGTGNFQGVIDRLDHVQYMRQKAIWISPHHPSGGKDGGYDIANYMAVNPDLGDMKTFERLVDEAHGRDIRVITEMVANHTSNKHQWFTDETAKLGELVRTKGRAAAQEYAESTGKEGPMYVWDFTRRGKAVNVRVDGPLIFNTSPPQVDAAVAGLGIALLPEDEVAGPLRDGRLERVLEAWCPPFPGYHLYYPSRRQPSPAFSLVVKALRFEG